MNQNNMPRVALGAWSRGLEQQVEIRFLEITLLNQILSQCLIRR